MKNIISKKYEYYFSMTLVHNFTNVIETNGKYHLQKI
jgi:hypothetical protein